MARCTKLVAGALVLCLLLGSPGLAWYKPSAGPRHYSVGRAAGLLSGFRGVQSARRSEPVVGVGSPRQADTSGELRPGLRTLASARGWPPMAMCIQDVAPHLHSCERLHDDSRTLQCTADVFLSLRADCRPTSAPDLKPGPAWPRWVPPTPTGSSPDPQPRCGDGAPHPPTSPSYQ